MSGIAQCEVQGLTIAGGAGGTLTNGNWAIPVPVTILTPTLATGGANQSSPGFFSQGQYWNGSASVSDIWDIADVLGSGTNPTTSLTISHVSGTPGAASVNIVATTFVQTLLLTAATPVAAVGQIGLGTTDGFGNGTAGTGVTTTTKGTGSGPTTPQTVVDYLQINKGGTTFWIPLMQ